MGTIVTNVSFNFNFRMEIHLLPCSFYPIYINGCKCDSCFLYEVPPTNRAKHKEKKHRGKKVGEDGNKCDRCKFNCSVLAKTKTI